MKKYEISYPYKGNTWSHEILADSLEDAKSRLIALRNAKVDGEIMFTVQVAPKSNLLNTIVQRFFNKQKIERIEPLCSGFEPYDGKYQDQPDRPVDAIYAA